jgi:two-component system alkaline phosphatase synthesis response regulator PhoP
MSKPRILIVDDDKNISRLMGILLEKTGRYTIQTENRSLSAHQVAREFHPDLCIFDVDMPGKDGGTLAREMRADPQFSQTPIIFLTSLVSPQEAGAKPMVSGGFHYLAKSVDIAILQEWIERLLPATAR